MAFCKNHPDMKAIYTCSTCGVKIYFNCFQEFMIERGRKRIGFCSKSCFDKRIKIENSVKNRAFIHLWIALAILGLIGIYFLLFYPFEVETTGVTIMRTHRRYGHHYYIVGLFGVLIIYQLANFYHSFFKSDPLVHYSFPEAAKEKKKEKTNLRQIVNLREIYSPGTGRIVNNLQSDTPFYLYIPDIRQEMLIKQVNVFLQFYHESLPAEKKASKIIIAEMEDKAHYIFFDLKISKHTFYFLMSFIFGKETFGYLEINGNIYQLNYKPGNEEIISGISAGGDKIEISLLDGTHKKSDNVYFPFSINEPDMGKVWRIGEVFL